MTYHVRVSESPEDFLGRAKSWLERREDHHNLMLGLASARSGSASWHGGEVFATLEQDGAVVGCVVRTPPHKALVTDLPLESAPYVAAALADRFDSIPAIFGPRAAAAAVAHAWAELRGVRCAAGMPQGLYRLDRVEPVTGVAGAMRPGGASDVDRAVGWGEGFARDTGIGFPPGRDSVRRWIDEGVLYFWEHQGDPVSLAVAQGRTRRGVRVGYVYTPPGQRGRGFAQALVAELSQTMLDAGCDFCVLYTDLTNPTSNGIYQRVGYELIEDLSDFDFE